MGKIVYLMGKSSTGKDTIYKEILEQNRYKLGIIVPYTTREIRVGEKDGREYHFITEEEFLVLKKSGKVIEDRAYETFHGLWRYFTVDDGQIDLNIANYIYIGTLESYENTKAYYGKDKLLPILIELDDGVRLTRALEREKSQEHPKYEEMCRRFLADSVDFSEDRIKEAGITTRFYNGSLEQCLEEISRYIGENINGN